MSSSFTRPRLEARVRGFAAFLADFFNTTEFSPVQPGVLGRRLSGSMIADRFMK
jgi:hypothetical protein